MTTVDLLDKGYVRLADWMGDDASVASAARVSFNKETQLNEDGTVKERDKKLINFLLREGHWSPFRHCMVTYEIRAPLMVARQHFKYVVGSDSRDVMMGWNEESRRYVTSDIEFHIPNDTEWRSKPDDAKQGSGLPVNYQIGRKWTERLHELCDQSERWFYEMLEDGICAEQARLILPAYGMYISWRWTASLQGVLHFLDQRLPDDAQVEIQALAQAVRDLTEPLFPATFFAWGH